MKIGVLTLTPKNNYGGILQATALCYHLESQGHDVVLINKVRFKRPLLASIAMKLLEWLPFQNIKNKRQDYLKTKLLKPFLKKYLPRKSRKIVSAQDLQKLVEDEGFDAVIVGSDQVWRYQYIKDGHHNVFFLDFETTRHIKKIAYAASFGKDEWEATEHTAQISRLLRNFDAISTREKSGVDLCENIFGVVGALRVLDPTMLVDAEFYERFFDDCDKSTNPKTIATYILDRSDEKQEIVIATKASLKPIIGPLQHLNLSEKVNNRFYSVEEWLWHIKNAEYIVTDSFHGMVFSIIFEKQFIVIGNEKRGLSRFSDLLNAIGLSSRLLLDKKNLSIIIESKIDYSIPIKKISLLKEISSLFLLDQIKP